jgi:hypothetical protein
VEVGDTSGLPPLSDNAGSQAAISKSAHLGIESLPDLSDPRSMHATCIGIRVEKSGVCTADAWNFLPTMFPRASTPVKSPNRCCGEEHQHIGCD